MNRIEALKYFKDTGYIYGLKNTAIFSKEAFDFMINKIYDDFEKKIDSQITSLEDIGWYEYDDKIKAIESLYELKELL